MFLINSTLLFLAASNLKNSPYFNVPGMKNANSMSFEKLSINRHFSNFLNSRISGSFGESFLSFNKCSFNHFLESAVKMQEADYFNLTFTSQRTISTISEVFFSRCRFMNCQTSGQGGGIYVSSQTLKKIQVAETAFYNCSATTNGAILISATSVIIQRICFNHCTAEVSNHAGIVTFTENTEFNFISVFRCPSIIDCNDCSAKKKGKNSIAFSSDFGLTIKFFNSSFNSNNDHGIVMMTHNSVTELTFPYIYANSGVDGLSVYSDKLYINIGSFINNTFTVAPFDSYASSFLQKWVQVSLERMIYLNNTVNPMNNSNNVLEGYIYIQISNSIIDVDISKTDSFGIGATFFSNPSSSYQNFTYEWPYFNSFECNYIEPSKNSGNDQNNSSKEIIVFTLAGCCCFVVLIGVIILVTMHFKRKKSLNEWAQQL